VLFAVPRIDASFSLEMTISQAIQLLVETLLLKQRLLQSAVASELCMTSLSQFALSCF
jgi:hypothetical protein